MKTMQLSISLLMCLLTISANLSANCVQEYYQLTSQAEFAICEHKLKEANELYQKAFALECKMAFRLDLDNALTVSCQLQNWKTAKQYATSLREKNYNVQYLKDSILSKHFEGKSTSFLDKVAVNLNVLRAEAALKQLRVYDQAVRFDCPGYPQHCRERIQYVDSITYKNFIKLLEVHGGWVPEIATLENIEWIFIAHNAMWQRYWVEDLIHKAVKEGKLHNDIYADCIDAWHHNNTNLTVPNYSSELWYVINKQHFVVKKMAEGAEEARKAIFLDSFEEQKKKLRFQAKHPEYRFSYNAKNVYEVPEESFQEILNRGTLEAL